MCSDRHRARIITEDLWLSIHAITMLCTNLAQKLKFTFHTRQSIAKCPNPWIIKFITCAKQIYKTGKKVRKMVPQSNLFPELHPQFNVGKNMNVKWFVTEKNCRLQHDDSLVQTISTCDNRQMTLQCWSTYKIHEHQQRTFTPKCSVMWLVMANGRCWNVLNACWPCGKI